MAVLTKAEIASLTPEERLTLIDELWDSLDGLASQGSANGDAPAEWERQILDGRLRDLAEAPGDDLELAEARKRSLL